MTEMTQIGRMRKHFSKRKTFTKKDAEKYDISWTSVRKIIYDLKAEGFELSRTERKGESMYCCQ